MGKVYGLFPLTLHPGVNTDEFEQAARRLIEQTPHLPGWRFALLKGERGEHVGQYQMLCEIDSLEARDRVAPVDGLSEEGQRWFTAAMPILEQWRQYTTTVPGLDTPFTDYHDITS
jgi:hypothetical protein